MKVVFLFQKYLYLAKCKPTPYRSLCSIGAILIWTSNFDRQLETKTNSKTCNLAWSDFNNTVPNFVLLNFEGKIFSDLNLNCILGKVAWLKKSPGGNQKHLQQQSSNQLLKRCIPPSLHTVHLHWGPV